MKQWTTNQQKAINTLDSNVLVSASAGSGKTSAMVERAINLITLRKVPIERIMLLTFTNNSAREMKERLREGLLDFAKNNEDSVDFIREQLDNMGLADISTIDSFCLKIVQEFFELVGLSPSVGIQSPEDEEDDLAKAGENTINRCQNDQNILDMMDRFSLRKDDAFLKIIRQMYSYLTAQPDRNKWLANCLAKYADDVDFEESELSLFVAEYFSKISSVYANRLRELFEISKINGSGKKKNSEGDYIVKVLSIVEPFEHCRTLKEVYQAFKSPIEKSVKPRGKDVDKVLIDLVGDIKNEFNDKFRKKLDTLFSSGDSYETMVKNRNEAGKQVKEIIKAVRIFGEEYDKIKAEQNKIDFADMERYAIEILSNDDALNEIRERHDYVFVDEFQDTNYLQDAIIRKITKPERLFVVGDVKQCIYRFRLAEPSIFINTMAQWQEEGKTVFFNDNFRSDPSILRFVNSIFDSLMTEDFGNIDYKNTGHFTLRENLKQSEVQAVTIMTDFGEAVEGEKEEKENKFKDENGVYDLTKHELKVEQDDATEAGLIYNYIQSVIGKKIFVKGEERIVNYSDIVLMYRNRNAPKATLDILAKAGVPLNMGDFEGNVGERELDIFMDYIQVINNSFDDYPLIGALHSFIGGLSNSELATIKQKSVRKSSFFETCLYYIKTYQDEISEKLQKFFEKTDRYRFISNTVEMSAFLKQVFKESGYSTYISSTKDGERIISAINGYFEKAKGKKYSSDLHSFVTHYLNTAEKKLKSAVSDANGVRVCTLHSSKGLEFPIVIFAGLDGKDSNTSGGIITDRELGVGMKYYNPSDRTISDTLDMKIIAMKKAKDEQEDKLRLLYVALTRPQSALCIILPSKINKCVYPFSTSSFAKWLEFVIRNDEFVASKVLKCEPHKFEESKPVEQVYPKEREASEELKAILSYKYPFEVATKTARKYSVSTLNSEEKTLTIPTIDVEESSFAGTAHHLVMQYIDLFARTPEEIQKELERMLSENILQKEQYEEISPQEIYDCLNSKIGELARKGECYREQKFVLAKIGDEVLGNGYQENVLVQGIIDLLIVGEKIVVVDFKRSKAGRDKLMERYRTQLKLYGDAVKEAFGRYPDQLLLYVFGRNEIIEIE